MPWGASDTPLYTSSYCPDAGIFRISSIGGDAGLDRTSALQGDANQLHVSAVQGDAGLLRVSSIGGAAGSSNDILVDGVDNTLSARIVQLSAAVSSNLNSLVVRATNFDSATQFRVSAFVDSGSVSAKQGDAGLLLASAKQGDAGIFRTSAFVDSGSVSAKQGSADLLRVSALQFDAEYGAGANVVVSARGTTVTSAMKGIVTAAVIADAAFGRVSAFVDSGSVSAKSSDGGTFRVSAIVDSGSVSAKSTDATNLVASAVQKDAGLFRVSGIIDSGSVSAKSSDAGTFHTSGFSPDAGLFRVSSMGADAGNDRTSALQGDAGLLHVSGFTATATNFPVSATQADAGLLRVSDMPPNWKFTRVTGINNTTVKSGAGWFHNLIVGGSTAKTINLYDSTAVGNNIITFFDAPPRGTYLIDIYCSAGITVSAVSATDFTVVYL